MSSDLASTVSMTFKPALALAALLAAVVPAAFAFPSATIAVSREGDFVLPAPQVVVAPARAPAGYENVTIDVKLVVDARGIPHQIDTLGVVSTEARELIVAAVRQWKFSPATRHGDPVDVVVILPLKLATRS